VSRKSVGLATEKRSFGDCFVPREDFGVATKSPRRKPVG
jgi:hypothetical protein